MSRLRLPLRSEAAFGLIEVMVSALLVVIISLAVLGAMDSASRASATSKAKAVAANLAQQDQERLQGMRPAELASFGDRTRLVPIREENATVNYSVRSEGEYVTNPGSNPGCTSGRRDEYLRIVSTVSWPAMRGVRPVRIESLVASPLDSVSSGRGSAVIKITRADGITPVVGLAVDLVGPTAGREPTGPEGCAFFADYPVGAYAFKFADAGWVNPNGDESVTLPTTIVEQEVATLDALYDRAGKLLNTTFRTRAPVANSEVARQPAFAAARAQALTLSHPGMTVNGGRRQVDTTTTLVSGVDTDAASITSLFPFASPYSVFSSSQCGVALQDLAPANLATRVRDSGGLTSLTVAADGTQSNRWVFEPALDPTVRYNGSGSKYQPQGTDVRVFVKSTNPACPAPPVAQAAYENPSERRGTLLERGFPYSGPTYPYSICADYLVPDGTYRNRYRTSGWVSKFNDQFDGVSWNLDIVRTTGPSTPCQ